MTAQNISDLKTVFTKSLVSCLHKEFKAHRNDFNNDMINPLELIARATNQKMNKWFRNLLKCISFKGREAKEFKWLNICGVYPFRFFDDDKQFYINDDDVFELMIRSDEFSKYLYWFNARFSDDESDNSDRI